VAPETRYARSGDVSVAYQIVGDGPFDVILVPGFVSHVELVWSVEPRAVILRQLASFSRLIVFDKRGTGMSDRVAGAPTLETRMDDVRAVMDAAGSERAALVGFSEGAPMSVLFAATYPERTAALVLWGAFARMLVAVDYPMGSSDEEYRRELEADLRLFGTREEAEEVVRSIGTHDPEAVRLLADYYRRSASPGAVESLSRMNAEIDVRQVLPAIRVPTLVVHGREDQQVPFARGSYLAERIPGARFAPFEGGHVPEGDAATEVVEEIEQFLSEVWDAGVWDEVEPERVLSTVMFTDIVGSSDRVVELGDRRWRELLERHHSIVRRQLLRFRGIEVDTAGDGFFASFDGPARAIQCACSIVEAVSDIGLEVRAGLHTGECELIDGKAAGIAVHTGARVSSNASPGEVLVSSTVKDLVAGSGIKFEARGTHTLKGIPGDWQLFAVRRNPQTATPETPAHPA
jgi:class 3 adenylate cyclase